MASTGEDSERPRWEAPRFEDVRMDAEFTAYCDDLGDADDTPD
jgi:hypothetical protein